MVDILDNFLYEDRPTPTNDPSHWVLVPSGTSSKLWQNQLNYSAFSEDGGKTYYLLDSVIDGNKVIHPTKETRNTMSVKHTPYLTNNGTEVRAVKVSAKNYSAVAKWSGGLAISKQVTKDGEETYINQRVRVGKLIAQIGDFVVREQIGESEGKPVYKFYRVKADRFDAEYFKN